MTVESETTESWHTTRTVGDPAYRSEHIPKSLAEEGRILRKKNTKMRFDIAFFLCCCRSFLSSNGRSEDDESFYDLLSVKPNAKPDELKRAYKKQSLLMHPDKLPKRVNP